MGAHLQQKRICKTNAIATGTSTMLSEPEIHRKIGLAKTFGQGSADVDPEEN
jgi:hypothetical protein